MGREKEIQVVTAKEAHELAANSVYTISHIYKEIKNMARENRTRLDWNLFGASEEALTNIIANLNSNGFKTAFNKETACLEISW